MATIEDNIRQLIEAVRTAGAGRLQIEHGDQSIQDARAAVVAVGGSISPEPLTTAIESLQGAHDMAQQAHSMATVAIQAIDQYIGAISG